MNLSKQQRAELKQKYGGNCAYCGEKLGDKWHADHIEPVRRNWWENTSVHPERDVIENLNPACPPCNINKHSCSLEGFRKQIEHYRDVQLLRDSGTARHLRRFGLLELKKVPVVFYFEKYSQAISDCSFSNFDENEKQTGLSIKQEGQP